MWGGPRIDKDSAEGTRFLKKTSQYSNGFPGIEKPVWLDQILQVASNGEVLTRINVLDVRYENDLEQHIVKVLKPYPWNEEVKDDPGDLNDIGLLASSRRMSTLFEVEDLIVSLRHPSFVFVFSPETGEVKWRVSSLFLHQHDSDFIGDGWVVIFSNNIDLTSKGECLWEAGSWPSSHIQTRRPSHSRTALPAVLHLRAGKVAEAGK